MSPQKKVKPVDGEEVHLVDHENERYKIPNIPIKKASAEQDGANDDGTPADEVLSEPREGAKS